jgi:DNA ligase-1
LVALTALLCFFKLVHSCLPVFAAGWGQIKEDTGLAMRFPRFTGRWRDDKPPQDATTTDELIDLYRTAQRKPAAT